MSDLGDLFKVIAEGKKDYETNDPVGQKIKVVKEATKSDLSKLFEELISLQKQVDKLEESKQENMIVEDMLTEEIPAQPVIPTQAERQAEVQSDVTKYLKDGGKSFQQPNPDLVSKDIESIRQKMKFLEQAIGKIAAAGPGGGEVNLRWLDDVDRSTIQDGYFLKYNDTKKKFEFVEIKAETALQDTGEPMGHQNRLESQLSFNNSTRVFSIAPTSASYVIYTRGTRRVITDTRSVTIPNTTGLYYIYFDPSGVLQYRTSFYDWPNDCMTAYVYWNADNQTAPFVADERHGITLDWQTHEYLHRTRGAAYANGFTASNYILMGDGSLDTHIQLNVANGTFFDEDLQVDIVHSNTPAPNTWEQDLQGPARIPIFYKIGNAWVIDSPTNFPVKQGAALPRYNLNTAGVWSVADIDNNKYGLTFIIATNNINYPVIGVIGQSSHSNESDAINTDFNELDLTGFPVVELRPLYKLIYDVKSSYSNTVKARLTKVTDLRNIQSVQLNNI
jgi:hypothetical protein